MPRRSAGLLPYRLREGRLEVLLAHMGGPLWARRDEGAWSIVKGEHADDEDPLAAARREFREETGALPPGGAMIDLGEVRQSGGKRVRAWAVEAELDPQKLTSNTFTIEWPPRSGREQEFPEIDRTEWCAIDTARRRLVKAQVGLLEALVARLAADG